MKQYEYTIRETPGLHARPAGMLVLISKKYEAKATVTKGEVSAELKRFFSLMQLQAVKGDTVIFQVEGPDEDQMLDEIKQTCEENL